MASDPHGSAGADGSADPAAVPVRPAGLPARVGDPLLPGGLPQKPVPAAAPPAAPATASSAPPPVRVSVSTPADAPRPAAPPRPRAIAVARARVHGAPRWARALVLGGATTVVLTGLLAAWQAYGPWTQAGQSGVAAPTVPRAPGGSGGDGDDGGTSGVALVPFAAGDEAERASAAAQGVRASRQPLPTPTPEPSPTPGSPPEETSPPLAAPELTAEMASSGNLFGRSVSVTVSNPGPGAASGWQVTVTVPADQEIRDVSGAVHAREGDQVVFTPAPDSEPLAPGEAVSFSFRLPGAFVSPPSGCTIDGRPCD